MKPLFDISKIETYDPHIKLPFECSLCKNTFYSIKKEVKKALRNHPTVKLLYCSNKCKHESQITSKTINCSNCNSKHVKNINQIKKSKSGNHFCSQSCAATYNNKHKTTGNRRSKLETYLQEQLTSLYSNLEIHYNSKDAINSELDIYIPSLKLAFELNGIFHYEPIYGNEKLTQIKNNDHRKFQACVENNISLCVIDTSHQKYFKEQSSIKYLNIIQNIIERGKCW